MAATLESPKTEIYTFFEENGYYLAKGVFSLEQVEELEADFDRIVAQLSQRGESADARWQGPEMERLGATQNVVLHTHNVQQYSALWLQALLNPALLDVAEAILGPDIVLHHTKLFQKPEGKGAPFPMHQDWSYFPTVKDSMIAGIIHVSNATDEMGCLRVYPGSHQHGRVEGTSGQTASTFLDEYPVEGDGAVALEAEPGDVAFFHYFTLHGSLANTSPHTRKTVLAQFHSGQDWLDTSGPEHINERLTLRGWNHAATRESAGAGKD